MKVLFAISKTLFVCFLPVAFLSFSIKGQNIIPCATHEKTLQLLNDNPEAIKAQQQFYSSIERQVKRHDFNPGVRGGGPRIIPMVFHVIHEGGSENISKEQIEDQVRILNEDYRRLNPDTSETREIFRDVAADCNIEFRLAQFDPDGNCTQGIVRVFSTLTSNADDEVKALSWWDNTKYLNVWVVRTIASGDVGGGGLVAGYAQLPSIGSAETDGVVIRNDFCGSIGTAQPFNGRGRTLTHEIGHYLGLLHPFQGECNPFIPFLHETIEDTPPVAGPSYGCNLDANTCDGPTSLPDMIENYMDYANGNCQNMFTLGQKDVMDLILDGSRSSLYTASNLAATGVDGNGPVLCAPIADFVSNFNMVCQGDNVSFTDVSYNGEVETYNWTFEGGNPATSDEANPSVVYDAPGIYDVTLEVSNAAGNDTKSESTYMIISPDPAAVNSSQLVEGFEEDNVNNQNWIVINTDDGNGWEQISSASFTGDKSIYINHRNGNSVGAVDEFVLPSVDMTALANPEMHFKIAYAQRSNSEDELKILTSTNCGKSWSMRFNKKGTTLATASSTNGSFTPSSLSDWGSFMVNLANFGNREHLMIKFQTISDNGNNIYIDDINLGTSVSVPEITDLESIGLQPNPAKELAVLSFYLSYAADAEISIYDITGKKISTIVSEWLTAGVQNFNIHRNKVQPGLYFIQMKVNEKQVTRKLLFE